MGLLPGLGEGHHYFCATNTDLSQAGVSGHQAFPSSHTAGTCNHTSTCSQRDIAIAFAPELTPVQITKGTKSFLGRWVSPTIAAVSPHLPLLHTRHKPPKAQGHFPGSKSRATRPREGDQSGTQVQGSHFFPPGGNKEETQRILLQRSKSYSAAAESKRCVCRYSRSRHTLGWAAALGLCDWSSETPRALPPGFCSGLIRELMCPAREFLPSLCS